MWLSLWRYSAGSALARLFTALSLLDGKPLGYLDGPALMHFSSASDLSISPVGTGRHCNLNAIFGTHKMARVTPLRVVHFLSGASPKESKFVSYQMCKLHPLQLREGRKEIMPF